MKISPDEPKRRVDHLNYMSPLINLCILTDRFFLPIDIGESPSPSLLSPVLVSRGVQFGRFANIGLTQRIFIRNPGKRVERAVLLRNVTSSGTER